MADKDGWSITDLTVSENSKVQLNAIPLTGYAWPAGQSMQINGTNFYVNADKGPNPIVTVGSDTASSTNTCGIDLNTSTDTSLVVVSVPKSPNGDPGAQTLYVKNFVDGKGSGATQSVANAITYVPKSSSTAPQIPVIFENKTTKPDDQVWIQFLNGSFGGGQTGAGGAVTLEGNKGYSLSTLTGDVPGQSGLGKVPNVSLNDFTNGRIYLNFGDNALTVSAGSQPNPASSKATNYDTQYAYIELNVFGDANNNMDISNIDFFSFTVTASTWKDGKEVGKLTSNDTSTLLTALEAVAPTTAIVKDGTDTVRIIGPGLASGYHDWTDYMKFLKDKTTKIGGFYAGTSTQPRQKYDLTASFDSTTEKVTLSGTIRLAAQGGQFGPKKSTTIVITYAEMNAITGVYGANPSYSVDGGPVKPLANDIYGWIVGDLLAGMNWGFPGSSIAAPGYKDKTMGDLTSSEWFEVAKANPSVQFGGAQTNTSYYNQYAAVNQQNSMAYGFPFTDRLGNVLLYFPPSTDTNGVDYLKITIS